MEATDPSPNHIRQWMRVLRPLFGWALLVLGLYGYRKHVEWSNKTVLQFSVSLQERDVSYESSVTVDEMPAGNGAKLKLFRTSKIVISHPKGISFSTNFFINYGEHNLGRIALARATGSLNIEAKPPARLISIQGPEFHLTLTNSLGTNVIVPTDRYTVEAEYAHWDETKQIAVFESQVATGRFAPRLGSLRLESSKPDASFHLKRADGKFIESGKLPALIPNLPQGRYELTAQHHGHQRIQAVELKEGITNEVTTEFVYGAVVFETEPPGAAVSNDANDELGITPLTLSELEPGTVKFRLRRNGYEPVLAVVEIAGNKTQQFRTNLISTSYLGAIKAAQDFLEAGEYQQAYEVADEALRFRPNDATAEGLKKKATGLHHLRKAKASAKSEDYIAGIKYLQVTLAALPDSEEAKLLLADFKRREPEQIEKMRVERLNLPKKAFEEIMTKLNDSNLFESYEFKSGKSYNEIEAAINTALQNEKPPFKLVRHVPPKPETFYIEAVQELSTVLATSAGRRQCHIVGGQTKNDETKIYFKILEYKTEAQIKFSIGNLLGTPMAVNYVAIHPSRGAVTEKLQARLDQGLSNITALIQNAIEAPDKPVRVR